MLKLFIVAFAVAYSTECKVKNGTMANLDNLECILVMLKACTNDESDFAEAAFPSWHTMYWSFVPYRSGSLTSFLE